MNHFAQSLGKVSEMWLDPNEPFRRQTVQALEVSTGYSARQIDLALANAFGELTREKIQMYADSVLIRNPTERPCRVLHILPSNAFTAWLPGVAVCLLLGHDVRLKPSLREPIFARAWKTTLDQIDSGLGRRVEIVAWGERWLHESPVVVAYGSDETLEKIRSQLPPGARFAGYGHKLSLGIIFQESLEEGFSENLLARVLKDSEPFRLQGCLSPQILYVENNRFSRWPVLEASVDVAPKIKTFAQWADVLRELKKFAPHLACVGYAGSSERAEFLERELRDCGVSRICPLGEMQRPPLSWRNGGFSLKDILHSSQRTEGIVQGARGE